MAEDAVSARCAARLALCIVAFAAVPLRAQAPAANSLFTARILDARTERPIAQRLEKVNVEAAGGLMAARLAGNEGRKKFGFGKFLDSTAFQQVRRRPFYDALTSRIPGIGMEGVKGQLGKFVVARRGGQSIKKEGPCYANVIVDGIALGQFDISQIDPDEVLAVEYHTAATVPLKYRNTSIGPGGSATCGTLIVWRK